MEVAKYNLQEIRNITNKPLEVFGLTMNELEAVFKSIAIFFAIGVIAQVLVNQIISSQPLILYYFILLSFFVAIFIKKINKKHGEGIVFFTVADFKNHEKSEIKNISCLKTKQK